VISDGFCVILVTVPNADFAKRLSIHIVSRIKRATPTIYRTQTYRSRRHPHQQQTTTKPPTMSTPFEMEQKLQYRLEQSRAHKNIQLVSSSTSSENVSFAIFVAKLNLRFPFLWFSYCKTCQETISRLQAELQKLYSKSIKRPRDSLAELDAKIKYVFSASLFVRGLCVTCLLGLF
jgi:exonuclease VII large subunit